MVNQKAIFYSEGINFSEVEVLEIKSSRLIDIKLEDACKKEWDKIIKEANDKGKMIWDSEIYRIESFEKEGDVIKVKISTIPFSIRMAMNRYADFIEKLGINYAPLGIFASCFIITSDCKYVFIKKSNKYYSNRKFSFIGGIFSKTENIINSGEDLFKGVRRELLEEIGIRVDIENIILRAGYVTENFNFCLIFSINLKEDFKTIENIFKKNNDGEALSIIGVNKKNVGNFAKEKLLARDWPKFEIMNISL